MTRHLVGLIDGTMVSASETAPYQSYSNVFELSCLLQLSSEGEDGGEQVVFYTSGISSQPDTFNPINLITGNSIKSQIIDQYTNICANFDFESAEKGMPDKIYLFGFSRGAMAVRALAGLIAEFGLLRPDDVRDLPRVLNAWDRSIGKGNLSDQVKLMNAKVEFIGLFDSVMGGFEWMRLFNPIKFKKKTLPARCRNGVQILAIDENRNLFKHKQWHGVESRRQGANVGEHCLRQVWMPGVHSDIGGTGNPLWGRAALLAMIHYIDRLTPLKLNRTKINEKETKFRIGVNDGNFIIKPHRGLFAWNRRKPMNVAEACERFHPICKQVVEANYGNAEAYPWQERIYQNAFAEVCEDPELNVYFDSIIVD